MPTRPPRPCTHPRCPHPAMHGKWTCHTHTRERHRDTDRGRGTATQRGYTSRWSKYSKAFIRANPLCQCDECKQRVVPLPAEVTDHITPHRGDYELFWDTDNHQAMNSRCHNRKTAREDGGFGRDGGQPASPEIRHNRGKVGNGTGDMGQ